MCLQGNRKRQAFTLIELLVVVAILAILAALLFPVFAKAREAAKGSVCQSNLRQLGTAIHTYQQDWDEKFPYAIDWADIANMEGWKDWEATCKYILPDAFARVQELANRPKVRIPTRPEPISGGLFPVVIAPYTRNFEIWKCPADTGMRFNVVGDENRFLVYGGDNSGERSAYESWGMSYGYRTELGLTELALGDLKNPSWVNVLTDGAGYWHTRYHRGPRDNDTADFLNWSYNTLFADGHVKYITEADYERAWNTDNKCLEYLQRASGDSRLR